VGRPVQAIEWYTKALAEDPSAHAVHTNRAAAYFNTSQLDEALADAQRAVHLEPKWTKVTILPSCHACDECYAAWLYGPCASYLPTNELPFSLPPKP
jgi:tetratricopeptide (TPR) repeat protein